MLKYENTNISFWNFPAWRIFSDIAIGLLRVIGVRKNPAYARFISFINFRTHDAREILAINMTGIIVYAWKNCKLLLNNNPWYPRNLICTLDRAPGMENRYPRNFPGSLSQRLNVRSALVKDGAPKILTRLGFPHEPWPKSSEFIHAGAYLWV